MHANALLAFSSHLIRQNLPPRVHVGTWTSPVSPFPRRSSLSGWRHAPFATHGPFTKGQAIWVRLTGPFTKRSSANSYIQELSIGLAATSHTLCYSNESANHSHHDNTQAELKDFRICGFLQFSMKPLWANGRHQWRLQFAQTGLVPNAKKESKEHKYIFSEMLIEASFQT